MKPPERTTAILNKSPVRPADCPGPTCENRNVSHLHCKLRKCTGPDCGNQSGRYCHAHED